jgi:trehalose 6-phosphate phosphatase
MKVLNREFSIDSFFESLKSAHNRILMLDYDGTLSPFTVDRDNANPYPGIREILDRIIESGKTRLIIISGRQLNALEGLLNLKNKPEMWGCHGAEHYSSKNGYTSIQHPESTRRFLSGIASWAEESHLNESIEIKPFGVAFHWRGLDDRRKNEIETKVEAVWNNKLADYDLELTKFDGGLEIRNRKTGKNNALNTILSVYHDDYAAAYLGDDYTDEDAFNALGDKGLKALVKNESRPTAADIILSPPEELIDFLKRWLNAVS